MDRLFYDIIDTHIIKTFNDPTIFFPSNKYNVKTNVFSIPKFFLYASLIILLVTNNWYLAIILVIFALVFRTITKPAIEYNESRLQQQNNIINACRKSTVDNPTGNVLLYTPQEELGQAFCPLQDKEMDKNIKYNFYFDERDLWQKKNNMRPFITMPSQTHPNDINKFTDYLYNFKAPTCKTNALNCVFNNDIRYHKNTFLAKI